MTEKPVGSSADNISTSGSDFEGSSTPKRARSLGGYIAVGFVLAILIGGAYAGFVATHTFNYSSTTAPIVNKSYTIAFNANEMVPTLATCSSNPCFSVTGTTPVTVTASSAWGGTSCTTATCGGVTLTMIYVTPLTTACSTTQPLTVPTTGFGIPLPGQSPASITLNGGTDYDYCIYYTSGASITSGSLLVNYQG